MHRGRRPDQLWIKPHGPLSPGRRLRRKDSQGRQAGRSAGPAIDQLRASRQSQHRQSAGTHRPAIDPLPRRRGHRMNRREVLLLLGGMMTAAPAVRAQRKAMPVIGFLNSGSPGPSAHLMTAFHQGLSETGYVEGQNLAIEYRWAEGDYDRLPALAADLIARKVDVIVTSATPGIAAAKGATSMIPIVFEIGADPVAIGLVASLARPGGNVTGVTFI